MSVGKFIFICDTENFLAAGRAAEALESHPDSKEMMSAFGDGPGQIIMFAKRLKRSIRVQQVKP